MSAIPRPALWLGLAGLIPFVVATLAKLAGWQNGVPDMAMSFYGLAILSFMGGALWGFAANAPGWHWLVLSVLPPLWGVAVLLAGSLGPWRFDPNLGLAAGFAGILLVDRAMTQAGLAPPWWMALRLLLSAVVIPCLMISVLA